MRWSDLNISWRLTYILLFFVSLFFYSCTGYHIKTTQPKGVYHRVKSGDTLWNIARAYKVNIQELAEVNNITDPNLIEIDSVIFIPAANHIVEDVMSSAQMVETTEDQAQREKPPPSARPLKEEPKVIKVPRKAEQSSAKGRQELSSNAPVSGGEMPASVYTKSESQKASGKRDREEVSIVTSKVSPKQELEHKAERIKHRNGGGESERIKFDRDRFIWPVKGKVRSKFGIQPNGMYYNGIRISAKEGTPVLAAAGGTVARSDSYKFFGETIIIKHEDEYWTVYYNLGSKIVRAGDKVKKGSQIAQLEKSDRQGDAYINFEIRYKNKARNPLFFLP